LRVGNMKKKCTQCEGFGKTIAKKGTIRITCPKCKGTGKVNR